MHSEPSWLSMGLVAYTEVCEPPALALVPASPDPRMHAAALHPAADLQA